MDDKEEKSLLDLQPGEWQFANGYSAIWINAEGNLVRLPISPEGSAVPPVWKWDGNVVAPTLSPSINVIGKWHGYLTAGKLVAA